MLKPLDTIDQAIIARLQVDSRTPSAEIARQVGVAERTVRARIDRLVKDDIVHLVAFLNPRALGYTVTADVFLEVELGQIQTVAGIVAAIPEVSYVGLTTGDRDISVQLFAPSVEALYDFVTQKLNRIPGVVRARTFVIPRVVKSLESWTLPSDAPIAGPNSGGQLTTNLGKSDTANDDLPGDKVRLEPIGGKSNPTPTE